MKHLFYSFFILTLFLTTLSRCALFSGSDDEKSDHFNLKEPKHWKKIDSADSDYAFLLPSKSVVTVNGSCHRYSKSSLELLTRQLMIGSQKFKLHEKKNEIILSGKIKYSGLYSFYKSEKQKHAEMALFVLKKNQCVYDFALLSKKKISEEEIKEFQKLYRTTTYDE